MNAHDFIRHQGLDLHDINMRLHLLAKNGYYQEARIIQRMSDVIQQQANIIVALMSPAPQEKTSGPDSKV